MTKIGFDNQKYLELQSKKILERVDKFGGKLYLEFGGKLFDDHHASRVLPGFEPDSKIRMLKELRDSVEVVIAICASDIEKNKIRGDLGITYDVDVLRLQPVSGRRASTTAPRASPSGATQRAFSTLHSLSLSFMSQPSYSCRIRNDTTPVGATCQERLSILPKWEKGL